MSDLVLLALLVIGHPDALQPGVLGETDTITGAPGTNEFRQKFWRPQPIDERVGLDGAQWILEGKRGPVYHVWDVWSPETSSEFANFRSLCLHLLRFSGVAFEPDAIY